MNPYTCHLPVTSPDANGWLPIESAPRDGTDVLLWRLSRLGRPLPPVVAGWFSNGEEAGWCADDFNDKWLGGAFTHWQPLPPPPTQGPEQ